MALRALKKDIVDYARNNFCVSLFSHSHDLFPHTLLQQLQRVSWLPPVRVKAEMLQKGCGWIDSRYCVVWGSITSVFINALHSFT